MRAPSETKQEPFYTWSWAGSEGQDLQVKWHASGEWRSKKDVLLIDGEPPERAGKITPFPEADRKKLVTGHRPGEVRSGPWEAWGAHISARFAVIHGKGGDNDVAIPRVIATHVLGHEPSTPQVRSVARLVRRETSKTNKIDRSEVEQALKTARKARQEAMF